MSFFESSFEIFRSISEVNAPSLSTNLDDKTKSIKPIEESVKKVKKLSETTGEQCAQNSISYVLPNEMDNDIKLSIEKLVKVCLIFYCKLKISLVFFFSVNSIGSNNN